MLDPTRPAGVTILTLVRDAASRLPAGEGSRADIVTLLQDSQYLAPATDPGSLTTMVSGALDRLQNEVDPCVKYDSARKVWTYLHHHRTLHDFQAAAEEAAGRAAGRHRQKRRGRAGETGHFEDLGERMLGEEQGSATASILETALAGAGLGQDTPPPPPRPSPPKAVQKIIVKGTDGKVIPLSAATLQKLIEAGAIKPGTQIATPDFQPDATTAPGTIRIVQHPGLDLHQPPQI